MEIQKVLVLSTGHLKETTAKTLNYFFDLGSENEMTAIAKYDCGYFLTVPSDPEYLAEFTEDMVKHHMEELAVILQKAASLQCTFVNFDRDGETYPEFPTFNW